MAEYKQPRRLTLSDAIRAWKDEDFRRSLTPEEIDQLPDNPAGVIKLLDADDPSASNSYFTGTCGHVCDNLTPTFNCYESS